MKHPEDHRNLVDLGGVNTQIRCWVEGEVAIHAHELLEGALRLLDRAPHAILRVDCMP